MIPLILHGKLHQNWGGIENNIIFSIRIILNRIRGKIGPNDMKSAVNISRIWLPIQTTHAYLKFAWLTGSNSTNNIEILKKMTTLEPFYGIRNILEICAKSPMFSHIFPVFDFRSKQQIHIWNLHDWLVLTVPITMKYSKNWPF